MDGIYYKTLFGRSNNLLLATVTNFILYINGCHKHPL